MPTTDRIPSPSRMRALLDVLERRVPIMTAGHLDLSGKERKLIVRLRARARVPGM